MSSPLIDILLPTYNNGPFLKEAVASILSQTFKDFQLVLVDDGSNDGSLESLPSDSRIHLIRTNHQGLVQALNRGLSQCSAPWIARADGDDLLHPDRLSKQILYANEHHLDWVSCQVEAFDLIPEKQGYPEYLRWHNGLISEKEISEARFVECPLIHPTWLIKTDIFKKSGNYREGFFPEDYEFFLRNHAGARLGKVPEVLLYWRDTPERLSRTDVRYSEEAFRKLKIDYFQLDKSREILLLGAGKGGRRLGRELIKSHKNLIGFADIDPKKCVKKVFGLPVLSPIELLKLEKKPFIINAVMTRGSRNLIDKWLKENGFEPEKDYLHFQ